MTDNQDNSENPANDMAEYLQTFLDETEEQLDDLVETMLALEQDTSNSHDLNEAFRLIHSIKGSAGMMGFVNITVLTHHLENRFERFRSGTERLDEPTMNLVLRCIDFLRQCNDQLRDGEQLSSSGELLDELQRLEEHADTPGTGVPPPLIDEEPSGPPQATGSLSPPSGPSPASLADFDDSDLCLWMLVRFRTGLQLADLKAQLIVARLSRLGEIRSTKPELERLSEVEQLEEFEILLETQQALDDLRAAADVEGVESIEFPGVPDEATTPAAAVEAAVAVTDNVPSDSQADSHQQPASPSGSDEAASLEDQQEQDRQEQGQREEDQREEGQREEDQQEQDRQEQDQREEDQREEDQREDSPAPDIAIGLSVSAEAQVSVEEPDQPIEPAVVRQAHPERELTAEDKSAVKVAETMRVDIDRLDNLMNLAGELVVNRARFVQVSGQISPAFRKATMLNRIRDFSDSLRRTIESFSEHDGDQVGDRSGQIQQLRAGLELMEEQTEVWELGRRCFGQIGEAIDQLSRVSHSLQRGVLETRMVPVGPLFNRFKRVVRDLSKQRGKRVHLLIRGEKTELDKRMIDELGDPLVHLVRNSLDHGLEAPDVRVARNKPEVGTILLEASHSGNNVCIQIQDDGGGIDPGKIKAKLIDKGILSESAADELTEQQALDYIWHPGLSTAHEVNDVSGRGVGMDVVKTRIGLLNGTIAVDSTPQQGTTFTLRLPLTLAIIDCLLVRLRSVIFAMPIDNVREIVSVDESDITTVQGKQTFEVRGLFLPLISINDVFHWHGIDYGHSLTEESSSADSGSRIVDVVILQSGGKMMGIRVDELVGSQDIVVKSLSDNFTDIRGLSGATILGDGTVCLMLDVGRAIDVATRPSPMVQSGEAAR